MPFWASLRRQLGTLLSTSRARLRALRPPTLHPTPSLALRHCPVYSPASQVARSSICRFPSASGILCPLVYLVLGPPRPGPAHRRPAHPPNIDASGRLCGRLWGWTERLLLSTAVHRPLASHPECLPFVWPLLHTHTQHKCDEASDNTRARRPGLGCPCKSLAIA